MSKQSKTLAALGAILVLGIGAYSWFSSRGTESTKPTVQIAINVPLTGPIAAWSGQFPNGFRMGLEDAAVQYKLDPKLFSVDVQDNAGNPAQAVTIFNRHTSQGFDAYFSVTTGAANAIAPQLDPINKPNFIAAFDPFITEPSAGRFRLMANSKIEAPLFIQYAQNQNAKRVYIVQLNFSYAEDEFGKIIQPALEKSGTKVTREKFELDQREFKNVVQKIKAAKPDVIMLAGYSFHLQPLLRDLRSAGLVTPGRVIATMDTVDLVYAKASTDELKDVVFIAPVFDIPGKVPAAAEWRDRFKAKFGVQPTYVPAYAYDNATLMVRAYAQSGKVDSESLLKALPFEGINGLIALDKQRDVVSTVALATLGADGQIVEVKFQAPTALKKAA